MLNSQQLVFINIFCPVKKTQVDNDRIKLRHLSAEIN
jgi:hypothetical protein